MIGILVKRGNLDTDMPSGRTSCEDEGRNEVMLLQAKECQRSPANTRSRREAGSFPHNPQKEPALPTP